MQAVELDLEHAQNVQIGLGNVLDQLGMHVEEFQLMLTLRFTKIVQGRLLNRAWLQCPVMLKNRFLTYTTNQENLWNLT